MQVVSFHTCDQATGAPLPRAKLSVWTVDSPPQLAPLFDAAGAPIANPIVSDGSGLVEFAAADGDYTAVVTAAGKQQPPQRLYIFDPGLAGDRLTAHDTENLGGEPTWRM